jgi:hypothetical protein
MVRRNHWPTTIRSYLHALGTCEQYHRRRRIDRLGPDALPRYQAYVFEEKKLTVGTVGLHVRSPALLLCPCAQATRAGGGSPDPEATDGFPPS